MNISPPLKNCVQTIGISILLVLTGSLELHAQHSSPFSTSGSNTYIPLSALEYAGTPFKIGGPANFLVAGNGFRAYYEIKTLANPK